MGDGCLCWVMGGGRVEPQTEAGIPGKGGCVRFPRPLYQMTANLMAENKPDLLPDGPGGHKPQMGLEEAPGEGRLCGPWPAAPSLAPAAALTMLPLPLRLPSFNYKDAQRPRDYGEPTQMIRGHLLSSLLA